MKQSKHIEKAFLFDIDGVLTEPFSRQVNQNVINSITRLLKSGYSVCLFSGRDQSWVEQRVLPRFDSSDSSVFDLFFLSFEYGGVNCMFKNGLLLTTVDKEVIISLEIKNKARDLVRGSQDAFFDEKKKTMATLEMYEASNPEEAAIKSKGVDELYEKAKKLIADRPYLKAYRTTLDVDILHEKASKGKCASDFLNFLNEKGLFPKEFDVFGDSPTDIEAAEELYKRGLAVKFYYLGEREISDVDFEVIRPKGDFYDIAAESILSQIK